MITEALKAEQVDHAWDHQYDDDDFDMYFYLDQPEEEVQEEEEVLEDMEKGLL